MLAHPGIEGRHRFVQQQQRRGRGQGASQCNPLLLAAGQLAGILFLAAAQADQFQHLTDTLANLVATIAGEAVGNVRFDSEIGEQRVGLEQNAVVPSLRCQVGNVAITEVQLAAVLLLQTGDAAQQGGLATARRPQQTHQLTGRHVE
ncbi:hypothetical protein D9M73_159390 [compost metagenome]